MTFGEKVFKLRCQNRMTVDELAEKLAISADTVSEWEDGTAFPCIENVAELSNLFKVSTDYLIKDDASPEQGNFYSGGAGELSNKSFFSAYTVSIVLASIGGILIVTGLILMALKYDPTVLFFAGVPAATVGIIVGFVKKSPFFKALWAVWIIASIYFAIFVPASFNILGQILSGEFTVTTIFGLILRISGVLLLAELIRRIIFKRLKRKAAKDEAKNAEKVTK